MLFGGCRWCRRTIFTTRKVSLQKYPPPPPPKKKKKKKQVAFLTQPRWGGGGGITSLWPIEMVGDFVAGLSHVPSAYPWGRLGWGQLQEIDSESTNLVKHPPPLGGNCQLHQGLKTYSFPTDPRRVPLFGQGVHPLGKPMTCCIRG